MAKKNAKKLCSVLATVLCVVTLAGCNGGKGKEVSMVDGEIPKELTIFAPLGAHAKNAGAKNNNDILSFQLMEEKTGCHVNWIHPVTGAAAEKFNLLIASGNLPDMIVHEWQEVPGGAKMYYEDEMIVSLTDLIDEHMPNLATFNKENPEITKQFTYDDGEFYYIPFIRGDEELRVYLGPQIREDWLKKLNLEIPKNTEELREVLMAFKTGDPNGNGIADEIPMSGVGFETTTTGIGNLSWAFGTHYSFYRDGNEIKYGILEDRFTEALEYISGLYADGLIDIDFLLNDRSKMDAKFTGDKVGFVYSFQPTYYANSMDDGEKRVTGIPHLTGPHGDQKCYVPEYANSITYQSAAITTANKNPVGTAKWLDEFFGKDGREFMNFGQEGKTFNWEDGYPRLTDYLLNNPNGKEVAAMCGMNISAYESQFPTIQDWRYYEQTLHPWAKESIKTWSSSADITGIIPPVSFTEEENEKVTQIMSQVETYVTENINKIVIGKQSIDTIPEIRERIRKMGIDDVIKIYNEAYKRYLAR